MDTTNESGTAPCVRRYGDIMCPAHQDAVRLTLEWPFNGNHHQVIRDACDDCNRTYRNTAIALGAGRSANIVLFPQLGAHDRATVHAIHEAGHAVADIAAGLIVEEISVGVIGELSGYPEYDAKVVARFRPGVDDHQYAMAMLAGVAAAEHYLTRLPGHYLNHADYVDLAAQAAADIAQVRELTNVDIGSALTSAREFVATPHHWSAITAVSQHLATHGRATGADVSALCGDLSISETGCQAPKRDQKYGFTPESAPELPLERISRS